MTLSLSDVLVLTDGQVKGQQYYFSKAIRKKKIELNSTNLSHNYGTVPHIFLIELFIDHSIASMHSSYSCLLLIS